MSVRKIEKRAGTPGRRGVSENKRRRGAGLGSKERERSISDFRDDWYLHKMGRFFYYSSRVDERFKFESEGIHCS